MKVTRPLFTSSSSIQHVLPHEVCNGFEISTTSDCGVVEAFVKELEFLDWSSAHCMELFHLGWSAARSAHQVRMIYCSICDLRDDLILLAAQENDWHIRNLRENLLAIPILMAEADQIFRRRKGRRNEFAN